MTEKEKILFIKEDTQVVSVSDTDTQTVVSSNDFENIATSSNAVGYLSSIDNSLTIIMMVVIVWFCIFNLRSWRTWIVKLRGRK